MPIKIILAYLTGYIKVEVSGYYLERFINICKNNKITIWNLKRNKNITLILNTTIKDFKENLYGLEKIQNNLANTHQKQQIIQENLEELRNNLDDIRYDITHFKVKKQQEEEKQKSIEEMLAKEGTNLNEQMEQCMRLKKQLPDEKDNLTGRRIQIQTELKNQKEKLIGIEEKVTKLQKRKEIAKSIFEQEANLKYIDLKEEELTKNIKYIIQK